MSKSPSFQSKALCDAMAGLLKEKRLKAGLSMTDVAESSGLARQMVGFVEKGARVPSLDTLAKLAIALKMNPSELLEEAEARCKFGC